MFCSALTTPLGRMVIKGTNVGLDFVGFDADEVEENPGELTEEAKRQLNQYFQGERLAFNLPIDQPGTPFQKQVWQRLAEITCGKPISYLAFSKVMAMPLAIRAIASANARNKLMIIVPCHRVIGSKGDLVGYVGGIWRKRWLLEHEARMANTGQTALFF